MMSIRQEDIAAENILKRAELNRITRQLKSRLSKTNLKSKLKEKKSLTNLSQNGSIISKPSSSNSKRLSKQKSLDSLIDANKTEDESSPIRNQLPPSSPLYEEFQIPIIPKTPPQQKITLNTDIYNSSSTNKTQLHLSSPARPQQTNGGGGIGSAVSNHLSTPKRGNHQDEGADLLMFLATSPSPIQYKNYPSTPSRALQPSSNPNSNQKLQVPKDSNHKFATPATPKRSLNLNNLMKTPGFNMNDYVNLFSPSPRVSRTPASQSQISNQLQSSSSQQQHGSSLSFQQHSAENQKDVNGKLIKF